jgi:putative peptide zinc metalloprotease protein
MADAARPIPLRMRADLVVSRERFGERMFVVVKDPLALRYFRLPEEEFAMLELLDGRRTFNDLQKALEARFAPQKFRPEDMATFTSSLHQSGLVISDARGQGAALVERRKKNARRAWMQKCLSPLAIRFRGIDPSRVFELAYPLVRPLFGRIAMIAVGLLMFAALGLIAVRFDEFQRKLPGYEQFFTPGNMLLLLGVLGCIKVLHEFGHGITCKHFGGECHELGLMFLVFAPCLYCNVSDAWRLPKRARLAVSAAGIVVELGLASLATFGWWWSEPGLFNQLCLAVMFVASVGTVLVNGNPLMRYDGYYLLSDIVETPNLSEKSSAVVRRFLVVNCLGIDSPEDPMLPRSRRGWFALYAVASAVYRVLLTFSIVMFLLEWLRPYDLEVVARTFGLVSLATMAGVPLYRLMKFLKANMQNEKLRRSRWALSGCAVAAAVAFLVFVPLPTRVWGTLELEPRGDQRVYVDVPGRLVGPVERPGRRVAAGQVLARLENIELELEIARLTGRANELGAELANLRRERFQGGSAGLRIPELEKSKAAVEELLAEKRAEQAKLMLVAPRDGVVLPPTETPVPHETALGELPTWSGLPSDRRNAGATLVEGTLLCHVGDPNAWQALVAVDQTDVELLAVGDTVDILLDELPEYPIRAVIDEISRRELSESPRRLSNKAGGELATVTDKAGVERPQSATYQVRVVLHDPEALLRIGLRGTAKIHVGPQPIAARVGRWMMRTFHFDL